MIKKRSRFHVEDLEARRLLAVVAFSESIIADGVAFPSTAISADFDNDGDLDIVVADREDGDKAAIFLFLNDRSKQEEGETSPFQHKTQIATDPAFSLNSTDIDGDGDLDILVGNFGNTHWLENVDSASHWIRRDSIASERIYATVSGDVDRDGDMDIVARNGSSQLVLLENTNGKGDFSAAQVISGDQEWVEEVELVDVDGDSDLDIVFSGAVLGWIENTGNRFANPSQILIEDAHAFGTGDYDNDGDNDIVAASRNGVFILDRDSDNFTTRTINLRSRSSDTTNDDVFFYDTDGDGDNDVLVQLDLDDHFGLEVVSNDAGEFTPLGRRLSEFPAEDVAISTRGDVNGDQVDDFVISTGDEGYVGWMEIRNDSVRYHDVPENSALDISTIRTADFDGDSDLDLLVASRGDAEVAWYENRGGEYVYADEIERISATDSVPFDVNEDGLMDVVTLTWSGLAWFENTGQSRFGEQRTIGSRMWGAREISTDDIDGDGTNELLVADSSGYSIFDVVDRRLDRIQRVNINDVKSIELGDADGDGDIDLVISRFQSPRREQERPVLYENNGGAFSRSTKDPLPESVSVWNVITKLGDFDHDGDADLLTNRNDQLVWFANNGDATWSESHTVVGDVRGSVDFEITDLDNDGDEDIVARDRWFENEGQGASFVEHQTNWGDVSLVEDVDFDGDSDVFSSTATQLVLNDNRMIDLVVRVPGDSNGDGQFNSSDFVAVFQAGQYEDDIAGNSIFETGDWNRDGEFDSSDFVFVFKTGNYVAAARQLEFAAAVDSLFDKPDRHQHRHSDGILHSP